MDIKKWVSALGFDPKENTTNTYSKQYPLCGGYCIDVDFRKEEIFYNEIVSDSKATQNFLRPENFVVLECVDRLLTKGYKPQNIILEKVWRSGHGTSGRLDICVNREDGSPYLLIECKACGKEFDKELARTRKDGGQLFTYFQLSGGKADVVMLYASELKGKEIVYKNEIIKIEDEYRSGEVKDIYDKWNKLTKDNGIFDSWVKPYNFQSKVLVKKQLKEIRSEDSSFIFNRFLEILRHNVVSDKGNAFNKIFTLFLCKVYDETSTVDEEELQFQWKEGVDNHVDFQLRLTELYSKGMQKFLERTVSDFNENEFNKRCANLNEETKKYLLREVNKLRLEKNNEFAIKEVYDNLSFEENARVVKEVVELIQGYKIRYNKRQQYLSDFFEMLLTTGLKQEAGQFFTPVPIAQFIIKSLPLDTVVAKRLKRKDGEILPYMIDYAAGSGHFLTEYMHEVQGIISQSNPKDYIDATGRKIKNWQDDHFDWATQYVYGVEKDYRLVKVGKVGCYLHGDGLANVILSDGLASFSKNREYKGKLRKDLKDTSKDNQQFDVLLSNPPYSVSSFRQTTRDYYTENDFELYDCLTDNSSEIECLFVERTKQLLKDGGVGGVILPSSILNNTGIYTKTREMILQYFEIVSIAEFGSNTFMATGTNTVVLFLRRRNNYDSKNIRDAVDGYFKTLNDVTVNGVETPIAKYVAHVWDGLDYTDYLTLLQKMPNDKVKAHEIYADYRRKIRAKDETKFWQEVLAIESEKLFYFIIAYPQRVVIVKSGEKEVEKRFLGYEFSNRRGNEGIHPIQRGKNIEECTQLFDAHSYDNPDKASTYIQRAFKGDFESVIAESMQKNVSRVHLVDMFTFDRADFEKTLSIAVKKKVKFDDIWKTANLVQLSEVAKIRKGTSITKEKAVSGNIPVIAGGQDIAYYHNVSNRDGNVITISASGAYSGFVNYFDNLIFASDCNTVQSKEEASISTKLIYHFLKSIQHEIYGLQRGQAQPHVYGDDIAKLKIPLPPKDVQEKILAEIEIIEGKEIEAKGVIKGKKEQIENICQQAYSKYSKGKLIQFVKTNPSKTEIADLDTNTLISFVDMPSVSNGGYITNEIVRPYAELKKGSYTYFREGDIIIAKITPCMENGKCALATNLMNGLALGSSEFHVFRADNDRINTKYLFALLNRKSIRIEAEKNMMGASGHRRVPITFYESLEIPVPSLPGQQKIVSEIEILEKEIAGAQEIIDKIPEQKAAILKKYL
jgi:type I restriction enzyme M protein